MKKQMENRVKGKRFPRNFRNKVSCLFVRVARHFQTRFKTVCGSSDLTALPISSSSTLTVVYWVLMLGANKAATELSRQIERERRCVADNVGDLEKGRESVRMRVKESAETWEWHWERRDGVMGPWRLVCERSNWVNGPPTWHNWQMWGEIIPPTLHKKRGRWPLETRGLSISF